MTADSSAPATLFRADVAVDAAEAEILGAMLSELVTYGWEEIETAPGVTTFRLHFDSEEQAGPVLADVVRRFPQAVVLTDETEIEDWSKAWKRFFTPVTCGETFVVLPPWRAGEFPDRIEVLIEPKTAFGTGHHPTTALCLTRLCALRKAGLVPASGRFLDLGTGSGVLGIGAAKVGLTGLGLDVDPIAIDNAVENGALNGVEARLDWAVGDLSAAVGEFDLIMANILADPLIDMAPVMQTKLKPGGALVLSGILTKQAERVKAAYAALGPIEETISGEWSALTAVRPS